MAPTASKKKQPWWTKEQMWKYWEEEAWIKSLKVAERAKKALQEKLDQLPAVDIQHAPAKLPSKLHMFAYVDFLAQSLCSVHSDCASKLGWINIGERFE